MKSNIEPCILTQPHPIRVGRSANQQAGRVQSEARSQRTPRFLLAAVISTMLTVSSLAAEPVNEWVQQIQIGHDLVNAGDIEGAEVVYKNALESAASAGDHVGAAIVWTNLGNLADRKGQVREAEKAYLRAINAFHLADVTDDRLLVRAHLGLIRVYILARRYSTAETLIRRLLADHPAAAEPDKASLVSSLAVILAHKGQFDQAEQMLRAAAVLCASTTGVDSQEVGAVTLASLAGVQMRLGRTTDAIGSYQRSLAMMETLPRLEPVFLAGTLTDYAQAARANGDSTTAENLYRRAIDVAQTRLGQSHPVLGTVLQKYAELVRDSGRKSEARKFFATARRIQEKWERENLIGLTVEVDSLLRGSSRQGGTAARLKTNQ